MKNMLALFTLGLLTVAGCAPTTPNPKAPPPGTPPSAARQYTCRLVSATVKESTGQFEATFAVLEPAGVENVVVAFPAGPVTPQVRKLAELVDAACTWGENLHEQAPAAKELVVRFRMIGGEPDLGTWTPASPNPAPPGSGKPR